MVILKNLGVDRLSCAYFVRSEPPQGSRIFLEPGIVVSGRRRGRRVRLRAARWARPRAAPAGSGSVPSPLGVPGGALGTIAVFLPGCRCFALSSLGRVSFASGLHLA